MIRDDRLPPLAQVPEWATSTDVARVLGIDRRRSSILIAAGALGSPYETAGGKLMVTPEHLQNIAAEGRVERTRLPDGLLVKVGPATVDPASSREWYGWDAALSAEHQRLATTRWWLVNDAERYVGKMLTVALMQIVVEQFVITAVTRRDRDTRVAFETCLSPDRDTWVRRRIATRRAAPYDLTGTLAAERDEDD
jgi:hypothetical protein